MSNSIIKVNNLTKVFGNKEIENKVLNNISFEINKGEFVSLMGESGSGKSTLLYLIGGLDKPTEGKVFINDKEARKKYMGESSDQLAVMVIMISRLPIIVTM